MNSLNATITYLEFKVSRNVVIKPISNKVYSLDKLLIK